MNANDLRDAGDPAPSTAAGGGALVRIPVEGRDWPGGLPALPPGVTATVTVSHERLLAVSEDELARTGYRLAGECSVLRREAGTADGNEVVDVFVPAQLREDHPGWFASLRDLATQIFDLRFGPVRYQLGPALRLHAEHGAPLDDVPGDGGGLFDDDFDDDGDR